MRGFETNTTADSLVYHYRYAQFGGWDSVLHWNTYTFAHNKKKKKKILENQVVKKILWEMKYDFLFTEKYFDKHIHTYSVKQKIKKIK